MEKASVCEQNDSSSFIVRWEEKRVKIALKVGNQSIEQATATIILCSNNISITLLNTDNNVVDFHEQHQILKSVSGQVDPQDI